MVSQHRTMKQANFRSDSQLIRSANRRYRRSYAIQTRLLYGIVVGAILVLALLIGVPHLDASLGITPPLNVPVVDSLSISIRAKDRNDLLVTEQRQITVPPGAVLDSFGRVLPDAVQALGSAQSTTILTHDVSYTNLADGIVHSLSAPASVSGERSLWHIDLGDLAASPLPPGTYRLNITYRVNNAIVRANGTTVVSWPATGLVANTIPDFSMTFVPPPELVEANITAEAPLRTLVEYHPGILSLETQTRIQLQDRGLALQPIITRDEYATVKLGPITEKELQVRFKRSPLEKNELVFLNVSWPSVVERVMPGVVG